MNIETKYASIDRYELKRLQADSAELERIKVALKVEAEEKHEALIELRDLRNQARQAPEGFALVPVEPTPEMLEAGSFSNPNANRLVYKAMLAAAPKGDSHE